MEIPVTYNGVVIGHTPDEGKTIIFLETETAKQVKLKMLNGKTYISSRSHGHVNKDGKIVDQQLTELSVY